MGRLPKDIEAKARKADELIKKLQGQNQGEPSAVPPAVNTPTPAPAIPEPPTNPPVDNQPVPVQPVPASVTPAPPAPAPEPVTPSPAPDDPNSETWKSRYTVLQGKYYAEVPRYASRVLYLENQIVDLNGQINALQSAPVQPTPSAPAVGTTISIADSLKDAPEFKSFLDNFPDIGPMVIKMVDMAANKIRQDTVQKFTALESNSVQDRQTKFATTLNAKHQGWQTMGQDSNWALWLGQKDRYSPKMRLALLKEAHKALDAETVSNMIDDFKSDMAKAGNAPAPNPPTMVTPTPTFVTPPSGPGSTPSSVLPAGPEAVTRSFIKKFYDDKIRGKYKGREDEAKKIKAEIDAATQVGRILNK